MLASLGRLRHDRAVGNLMGGPIGASKLVEWLFARNMYQSLYRPRVKLH